MEYRIMPTRNVVLTEHQADLIERLVSEGRYQNASEVMREGLRLIEDKEAQTNLRVLRLRQLGMKIRILSDLHLEFQDWVPPKSDVDIVVLAGDIHVGDHGIDWAPRSFPPTPVIYVPGNHEFYGIRRRPRPHRPIWRAGQAAAAKLEYAGLINLNGSQLQSTDEP